MVMVTLCRLERREQGLAFSEMGYQEYGDAALGWGNEWVNQLRQSNTNTGSISGSCNDGVGEAG